MSKTDQKKPCFTGAINQITDEFEINLNSEIGFWGTDAEDFDRMMFGNSGKSLLLKINCDGGSINAGMSILNSLKTHPAPINIIITGAAASMGSVVSMGGDSKPKMYQNTMFMMHKPSMSYGGNADELQVKVNALNGYQENIELAYMRHFNGSAETLTEMVNKTTYLTATEAESFGLAEVIPEDVSITNFLDCEACNYAPIPEHVKEMYKNKKEETIVNKVTNLFNKKEPKDMAKDNEFQDKINSLEGENKSLKAVNLDFETSDKALKAENLDLKSKISDRDEADAKAKADEIEKGIDSFLEGVVKTGHVLPVNVESEKKILMALSFDTDLIDAQKFKIENGAKDVDLDSDGKATNGAAKKVNNLDVAAKKYAAENKISYGEALRDVIAENPELDNGEV